MLGDLYFHFKNMQSDKMHYIHLRDDAPKVNKFDFKADVEGIIPMITVVSEKAYREVVAMMPTKVDKVRWEKGLFKLFQGSFSNFPTSELMKQRRRTASSLLGVNKTAKYLPVVISNIERGVEIMKKKGRCDFMEEINAVAFHLAVGSFFGRDIDNLPTEKFMYEHGDRTAYYTLSEYFVNLNLDIIPEFVHPVTNLFPPVNSKNLINPWKRNQRNLLRFRGIIREMAEKSKDKESLWHILGGQEGVSPDDCFNDLFLFIIGGSDTTSHNLVSFMYLIKKNPECFKKLKEELTRYGITGGPNVKDQITFETLLDIDYLTYLFKETLRMDTAVQFSFYYQAKKKIKLCGVPLEKGTIIKNSFTEGHYSEDHWLEPRKFVPERFDTDSDFFKESQKQGKVFNSYSRRSFGLGPRKCPGESFALLAFKAMVAYLTTMMEFDIDKELLESDSVGFALGSHQKLMMNVK